MQLDGVQTNGVNQHGQDCADFVCRRYKGQWLPELKPGYGHPNILPTGRGSVSETGPVDKIDY